MAAGPLMLDSFRLLNWLPHSPILLAADVEHWASRASARSPALAEPGITPLAILLATLQVRSDQSPHRATRRMMSRRQASHRVRVPNATCDSTRLCPASYRWTHPPGSWTYVAAAGRTAYAAYPANGAQSRHELRARTSLPKRRSRQSQTPALLPCLARLVTMFRTWNQMHICHREKTSDAAITTIDSSRPLCTSL